MNELPLTFAPFIGRTVSKLELSDDRVYLRFTMADGQPIVYRADGDCCSFSWVYEVCGVKSLLGYEVRTAKDAEFDPPAGAVNEEGNPPEDEYEVLADYSAGMTTDRGYFDVYFRNTSNGYYGGELVPVGRYTREDDHPDDDTIWRELKDDWQG